MTVRRLGAALGFVVAVGVLWIAGRGVLAAPPLSVGGFAEWLAARGAATAAVALVRVGALVAAAWMAAVTAGVALAEAAGAARLAATAERALPRVLRRAAGGVAGAGLASVVALGGVAAGPAAAQDLPVAVADDGEGTATMSLLADDDPAPAPAPPPESPASPVPPVGEWLVEPGDSFWSIAEELVGDALGRHPSGSEVAAYWRTLVDANRTRLVTPDPDLLLPGQSLALPASTGVPGRT